jgi:hypothetical protein
MRHKRRLLRRHRLHLEECRLTMMEAWLRRMKTDRTITRNGAGDAEAGTTGQESEVEEEVEAVEPVRRFKERMMWTGSV